MKRSKEQQEKIAQTIRKKRIELGMKQQELAKRAYISRSDMCKIELANKWVESDELRRIANALGVETGYLLGTLPEETQEKTDVAAVMPLDSKAIGLLLDLKKSCARSEEARFVSDLISYFIKALLGDICGEDGISLANALTNLSYFYEQDRACESAGLNEVLLSTKLKRRRSIIAEKEEVREAATRIFTEFCKSRPIKSLYPTEDAAVIEHDVVADMIIDEMHSAYADNDTDTLDELNQKLLERIFLKNCEEVEEDGDL